MKSVTLGSFTSWTSTSYPESLCFRSVVKSLNGLFRGTIKLHLELLCKMVNSLVSQSNFTSKKSQMWPPFANRLSPDKETEAKGLREDFRWLKESWNIRFVLQEPVVALWTKLPGDSITRNWTNNTGNENRRFMGRPFRGWFRSYAIIYIF